MKTNKNTSRKKQYKLPPFKVKRVVSSLTQSQGWGIKQLRVPETWTVTQGEGITVMVIDTGYTDHPDLEGAIDKTKCRSFIPNEPDVMDLNGHSTHCCGIIGARDNGVGMVGVAPKCNIITVKVLGENGSGGHDIIRAGLEYAKKIKPDVISMSLGSPFNDIKTHSLIKDLYDMNIPVIAAAGNDGRDNAVNYPGKYPETICVTAYDKNGKPARFNSAGPQTDFSAPGVDIYSTWLNKEYAELSGTSMATPFIAGLVALLIAKHKKQEAETGKNDCKTVAQIKEHLVKYADDRGVVGKDAQWGYGVVDPYKLITNSSTDEIEAPPPIGPVNPPVRIGIRDIWMRFIGQIKRLFGV